MGCSASLCGQSWGLGEVCLSSLEVSEGMTAASVGVTSPTPDTGLMASGLGEAGPESGGSRRRPFLWPPKEPSAGMALLCLLGLHTHWPPMAPAAIPLGVGGEWGL